MDSNRTSFILLKDAEDFANRSLKFVWDDQQQVLRFEQQQAHFYPVASKVEAIQAWSNSSAVMMDGYGQIGRISTDNLGFEVKHQWAASNWHPVLASTENPDSQTIDQLTLNPVKAPAGNTFIDLHLGGESLAGLAFSGSQNGVLLIDLQKRWQQQCETSFAPQRIWVDSMRRVWVVADGQLAMVQGEPLPQPFRSDPLKFSPKTVNPNALQQRWSQNFNTYAGVLALCADPHNLYILVHEQTDDSKGYRHHLLVRSLDDNATSPIDDYVLPEELPFAIDCAVAAPNRVALLCPKAPGESPDSSCDCPVVWLHPEDNRARLAGERYRMLSLQQPRFVGSLDQKTRYLNSDGPKPLLPLPQARFPRNGACQLSKALDSGTPDNLWHRLYLEACIPPGCRLQIQARSFDDDSERQAALWQQQPEPLWLPLTSELPFYMGWKTPEKPYQGLYQILLQRQSGVSREMRGRFLQLKIVMSGDGRHSPAIHAVRAYTPRFSWQQHYLPSHFQQQKQAVDGEQAAANGADFRERMLATFEGMLTPVEDRIGASELLLDPLTTPDVLMKRLAAMIGVTLPAHWPDRRQRDWLRFSGDVQRLRGSMAGLCLALDIATEGGVSKGQVIPVEHFRLRRTLSTILGLDLSDDEHPLTLGTGQSGNSIVGDSLILSAENAREFLALLAPELVREDSEDQQIVSEFFDRYSHRVSVILHGPARDREQTVRQLLSEQMPAHLQWTIRQSDSPFILGLSPLLQIDTYLQRSPVWKKIILDRINLGRDSLLHNTIALAPELAAQQLESGD
jgi:hypothetical protein